MLDQNDHQNNYAESLRHDDSKR